MPTLGGVTGGYGAERSSTPDDREKGYRRRKLAAMAGNLYRSGQAAVTELKESYAQTRTADGGFDESSRIHIPGAFPDVAITVHGDDQMVLFPSYAKFHAKKEEWEHIGHESSAYESEESSKDEDYWRHEWEKMEDEKAIVDVDIRGWVYSPRTGPVTRRNRMLIGLARQLSGIPAPRADQATAAGMNSLQTPHQRHEEEREQERIAREAARIERQGREEERVAYKGGYSERPPENCDVESEDDYRSNERKSSTPSSPPGSPYNPPRPTRTNSTNSTDLTEAELAVANANLMARISPFMTNPMVALPITLFFYNDTQSQSKTVMTNDTGHFVMRAALDFIPTHIRVLATENLSATQEVKVIEPCGVSLISDIDDTVKRSNISAGAKEIFRNTFVRDLADLTIEGVKEWYNSMHNQGVMFHYCSNSPWQLYPVLASFFKLVGLPPGSLHLKQYSGMLQGIFEPVAERKKSTLNRLLRDFPERQFLLVGDSGEADLEVYMELAMANPGRILAVFIRDVTTPEEPKFFDAAFGSVRPKTSSSTLNGAASGAGPVGAAGAAARQNFVSASGRKGSAGPVMGTLIDFSDESEGQSVGLAQINNSNSHANANRAPTAAESLSQRKPPPPRPAKPVALRSARSVGDMKAKAAAQGVSREYTSGERPPPPPPRKSAGQSARQSGLPSHFSQMGISSQNTAKSSNLNLNLQNSTNSQQPRAPPSRSAGSNSPPPPPLPRRRTPTDDKVPSAKPKKTLTVDSDNGGFEILPPPVITRPATSTSSSLAPRRTGTWSGDEVTPNGSPGLGPQNKKVELWRRRLARAHEELDRQGVQLYTWRRGHDVIAEAEGIIKSALRRMESKNRRGGEEGKQDMGTWSGR